MTDDIRITLYDRSGTELVTLAPLDEHWPVARTGIAHTYAAFSAEGVAYWYVVDEESVVDPTSLRLQNTALHVGQLVTMRCTRPLPFRQPADALDMALLAKWCLDKSSQCKSDASKAKKEKRVQDMDRADGAAKAFQAVWKKLQPEQPKKKRKEERP